MSNANIFHTAAGSHDPYEQHEFSKCPRQGTARTDKTKIALGLLHEASRRGFMLKPAGDKLAVIPAQLCTSDFAAMLREHKGELLAVLAKGSRVPEKADSFQFDLLGYPAPTRKLIRKRSPVVKPYRPLTQHERDLLRRKGMANDPLIIEALNIFEGRIVG